MEEENIYDESGRESSSSSSSEAYSGGESSSSSSSDAYAGSKSSSSSTACGGNECSYLPSLIAYNDRENGEIGQCRICHGESEVEDLLSPCLCKGTAAYVHQSCLDEWINHSKKKKSIQTLDAPRPTSNRWEDIADFLCTVVWTYMLIYGIFFCTNSGTSAFNDFLVEALKSTRLVIFWWLSFLINCAYYLDTVTTICQRWIDENSIYEWKTSVRS
uniref:RING-CH-type domain-containing protein n=1 Tax=Ditylenchus dipsaci TaxID=166011 RepID=A0A915DB22_9BILA